MAVKSYLAEELIELMHIMGNISGTPVDGTEDADLLQHLNQAMMTELVPELMKRHEEYFVVSRRYEVTTGRIRIPTRAVGNKMRDIRWLNGTDRNKLRQLNREDLWLQTTSGASIPWAFYLEGNHIVFVPELASGTTEISFCFRPGQLVLSTETRRITAVDITLGTLTLASEPPIAWDASLSYDIHGGTSGAEIKQFDLIPTDITSAVMTFDVDDLDGTLFGSYVPEVGDYICLAGEAALPALPIELHPTLAQAALVRTMEASGDAEQVQMHAAQLNRSLEKSVTLTETRVDSQPKRIIRHSPFI